MLFKKLSPFQHTAAVITVMIIILFYFFFNLNYLSDWVDEKGDARTYNYYVRLGLPRFLYNPHHLFFDRLGQWMYETLEDHGYDGSSMRVLQLRNLILSSVCLGLIFYLFYFLSHRYLLSLLFTLVMSFSCAVWIYAQINDTGLIHSILVFLLFFVTLYFPQAKHKILYSLFLSVFHSMIILTFHQTDIIFVGVIFFIMVFSGSLRKAGQYITYALPGVNKSIRTPRVQKPFFSFQPRRVRFFLIYLFILIIIVAAAYFYIGIVILDLTLDPGKADYFNQIKGSTYFFNWIVLYSNINYWGKGFLEENLFDKAVKGIASYFYQPGEWGGGEITWDLTAFASPRSLLPNLLLLFICFILISTIFLSIFLYKRYTYGFTACLLYLFIYVIFACWWEPDYREFWIAPMFSFWFLGFLVINLLLEKLKTFHPLPQCAGYFFLFILAGLLFYINFNTFIYPNSSRDYRVFTIKKQ